MLEEPDAYDAPETRHNSWKLFMEDELAEKQMRKKAMNNTRTLLLKNILVYPVVMLILLKMSSTIPKIM